MTAGTAQGVDVAPPTRGDTAGVPGTAELQARAVRQNGTLGAVRIMLSKLEAEVRWARRHRGLQFRPAVLLQSARMWANRHVRRIHRSGLFDTGWYLWCNPDVEASGEEPILHYWRIGWREGRDPSPFFSVAWYLDHHPDIRAAGLEPLSHYIDFGAVEGRDPHPVFNNRWYLTQNRDVAESGSNPLSHYIHSGGAEGRDPHPWFRTDWYLARNPDVARSGLNPLFHYIVCGAAQGRDTHPWFKGDWYLAQNRAAARRSDPLLDEPQLLARAEPALPSALVQLLRMFHDESATPVIESCNALLGSRGANDASFEEFERAPRVASLLRQAADLARRASDREIEATIVVASAGNLADVLCCLYAVLSLQTRIHFEIIVETESIAVGALADRIGGVVRYCRDWRAAARGTVLVFLGSRSIVLPNWLDELLGTLKSDSRIGLVRSKQVDPDGALQGAAQAGPGGHDACAPQCNYLKDVTGSGVSMAVPKALCDRLGAGADLAMRVRAAGLRTVYQPLSAVIHHGDEAASGAGEGSAAAAEPPPRPRILAMDHAVPQPDRDAGSRSSVQYLQILSRAGFHVTFWPQDLYFDRPYVMALQRDGIEVMYGWSGVWPDFDSWLEQNKSALGYAYLLRPTCAVNFIDRLRHHSKAKILFAGVDVHFKRLEMEAGQSGSERLRNDARRMERLEKEIWQKSDVVHYLSDSEVELVKATFPAKTARALPIFMFDRARLREAADRVRQSGIPGGRQLFFVGGFRHSPNVDAMIWFAAEIWPRILAAVPDARLTIAGSSPPAAIRQLASDAITVSGPISDAELIRRYIEATVAVVPLRFGAGVKGKLLEAMSYGAPVVTTSVGTQGLAAAEPFVDVRDDARGFAAAVIDILERPNSRSEKVLGGLQYLEQDLTEAAALRALSEDIPELRAYRDRTPS